MTLSLGLGIIGSMAGIVSLFIILIPEDRRSQIADRITASETRIGLCLLRLNETKFDFVWHEALISLLDRIFGRRKFSGKALIRTGIQSYLLCVVLVYALMIYAWSSTSTLPSGMGIVGLLAAGPLLATGVVTANLIPDFIAVGASRWAIEKLRTSGILYFVISTLFVFLVSLAMGVASILVKMMQLYVSEGAWTLVIADMQMDTQVAQVQYTLAFLTTFSIQFWIALFFFFRTASSIANGLARLLQLPTRWNFVIDYPVRALLCITLFLALVLILLQSLTVVSPAGSTYP